MAAGSGITPVISILGSTLIAEPGSRATLLYANRDRGSTMFGDELTMLARQFEGRLRIVHVHSRSCEPPTGRTSRDAPAHERTVAGRLDNDRLAELWHDPALGPLAEADAWYLCGPDALADGVEAALAERGVPPGAIHRERFTATSPATPALPGAVVPAAVTLTLGGRTEHLRTAGDESLLEAALRHGMDAPYSCTGGACATCRARLLHGTVHMEQNYALSAEDVAGGWVLTCQARPTSGTVVIDYDR